MKQAQKLASLENWSNDPTDLPPSGVARVFAMCTIRKVLPQFYDLAIASLDLYDAGNVTAAKSLLDVVSGSEFGSGLEYLAWAQFKGLYLKAPREGNDKLCEAAATKKFVAAEMACKRANRRLRFYWRYPDRENPVYRVILTRAKELISQTLGNLSENVLERILCLSRPGGGTAVGTTNPLLVDVPWKLGPKTRLAVSQGALPYGRMLVEQSPRWLALHVQFPEKEVGSAYVPYVATNANRVAFVPKDAATHRTIAVEPHLNVCLQLGTGAYLKSRLRGVGIDLSDQGRNQSLAQAGALDWQAADPLVTLDLAAASDSLSVALVERLIPTVWRDFLGCLRSTHYTLGRGLPVEYQKWSSMGNGYTFELETLIFWALGKACSTFSKSKDLVSVYGDDIILPRGTAGLLIEVLRYVGFKVNTEKSALFGPFRESCGADYWFDMRVVPVYLRDEPYLRPTDIYRLVNTLRREWLSDDLRRLFFRAHRGRPIVYGLPTGNASGCWWTTLGHALTGRMVKWNSFTQSWRQRVAVFRPIGRDPSNLVGYAAALLGSKIHQDPEWLVAKSNLRRKGKWCLSRVYAG